MEKLEQPNMRREVNVARRRLRRVIGLGLVMLVLFGCTAGGVAGGVVLDRRVLLAFAPPSNIPANAAADFKLMAEAWNTIQGSYVDRSAVQSQNLTYGAIGGMVSALGDTGHSRFLTPDMVREQRNMTQGQFEGVGLQVQPKDSQVVVVSPIDGTPAQRAGIQPGDVILKVDGKDIAGLPLEQVISRIIGPAGTQVTLTIHSPASRTTRDIALTRARIAMRNVTWRRLPGTDTAHLRIAAYSRGVSNDLAKALEEIQQQGLTGIVLDVRNNPGGLLDEAVGVVSQFVRNGNALLTRDAQGKITSIPVDPDAKATDLPVVVLINQGTASAAEITAGALQDAGRAQLVGEKTFGTGTVLNQFRLDDGSALLMATQEWLTPAGRSIWHNGIRPDIEVTMPPEVTLLSPESEQGMTDSALQQTKDAQLLRGLELLGVKSPISPRATPRA